DVLSVVSHDLRNPLAVISMCTSSLMEGGVADDESNRDAISAIRDSTQWAQRLIRDLLDVAAIEAGGLSLTRRSEDPVLLVTRAALYFEDLASSSSISLETELPEHLSAVFCDADRMLQALGNLIGNGLKFAPPGGKIRLGAANEGEWVRFFVEDDGAGIPQKDVPHIFDRFWTARRDSRVRGAGMGLAIVRGIVEAHGGQAWVERGSWGGARFNLLIPAKDLSARV
ncbi:MAG: ATP-binding protein, partial [Gemmatimonadota bacterium]|nr:ATP-binding protein [Gemmatimonadota bacterium]